MLVPLPIDTRSKAPQSDVESVTSRPILAPIARGRKGEYKKELEAIAKAGFRARIDGELRTPDEPVKLDKLIASAEKLLATPTA